MKPLAKEPPVQALYGARLFDVPSTEFSGVTAYVRSGDDGVCSVRLEWTNRAGKQNGYSLYGINARRFRDAISELEPACAASYVLGCIHHWGI